MTTTNDIQAWTREAHQRGVEAALAAASWVLDGNHPAGHYARLAQLLDDGDPRAEEYLPARPNLSGEWADAPTPRSLFEEITGQDHEEAEEAAGLAYETLVGSVIDALADAYEEGVSETFDVECERLVKGAIG